MASFSPFEPSYQSLPLLFATLSRSDFESLLGAHAVVASKIALQLARQFGRQLREHVGGLATC